MIVAGSNPDSCASLVARGVQTRVTAAGFAGQPLRNLGTLRDPSTRDVAATFIGRFNLTKQLTGIQGVTFPGAQRP